MQELKVAAASVRNLLGDPAASIEDMRVWSRKAAARGAELILFPELNLCGHVRAPIVNDLAETVPGPSTEKIVTLAE
ncbi:nitrilase-related carbon-nitrogen hydrolase, partial [Candidatus Eisenbacteria bacterium]